MSNSLCQGWGRQGQATLCLSTHRECHINCHRHLTHKETVTGKDEGDRAKPHYVYQLVTSIRQLHMNPVIWTVSVKDEKIIQQVPSVPIRQMPSHVTATQQQTCTKMREENRNKDKIIYKEKINKFYSQLNTSGREPSTCDTPVSHSIDIPTEELKVMRSLEPQLPPTLPALTRKHIDKATNIIYTHVNRHTDNEISEKE